MQKNLIVVMTVFLFASCRNSSPNVNTPVVANGRTDSSFETKTLNSPPTFDTTLFIFSDTAYKLTLHVFNTNSSNRDSSNSSLTFTIAKGSKVETIFRDSLYCMSPMIEFRDFNNDRIRDVLLFYFTGARANPTYHLYLVDTTNHRLTYVKGFENLPNAELDSVNNIIYSSALYGTKSSVSFYRIDSKSKLINLRHSFESDFGDDKAFDRAIKQILKEQSKKHTIQN